MEVYSGIHVLSNNFNGEERTWLKRKKDDICFIRERFFIDRGNILFYHVNDNDYHFQIDYSNFLNEELDLVNKGKNGKR